MDKTYTITLSDGTVIDNLTLNGNNFISETEITEDMFSGKLKTVTISDGESTETHTNMALVQVIQYEGAYWFILRDMSKDELLTLEMQGNIDYIAMMADIELPESEVEDAQ